MYKNTHTDRCLQKQRQRFPKIAQDKICTSTHINTPIYIYTYTYTYTQTFAETEAASEKARQNHVDQVHAEQVRVLSPYSVKRDVRKRPILYQNPFDT